MSARKTCSELDLRSDFAGQFASIETETGIGKGREVGFYKQFERVVRILWTVFQKMTEARVFPQSSIDKQKERDISNTLRILPQSLIRQGVLARYHPCDKKSINGDAEDWLN